MTTFGTCCICVFVCLCLTRVHLFIVSDPLAQHVLLFLKGAKKLFPGTLLSSVGWPQTVHVYSQFVVVGWPQTVHVYSQFVVAKIVGVAVIAGAVSEGCH